jgi:hypothetical protein
MKAKRKLSADFGLHRQKKTGSGAGAGAGSGSRQRGMLLAITLLLLWNLCNLRNLRITFSPPSSVLPVAYYGLSDIFRTRSEVISYKAISGAHVRLRYLSSDTTTTGLELDAETADSHRR